MEPDAPPAEATVTAAGSPLLRRLSAVDVALSRALHQRNFFPRSLFLLLELSADFRLFFPLALAVYLSPALSALLRPLLVPLILGLLLDLALIGLIKVIFRRPRPVYNKDMSVAVSVDHYSFPSGHSSRVCFVAALFCLASESIQHAVVADHRLVLGVWLWAVATSVSRVLLGRHFVFDVFVGSCLGVLEGLLAFHYLSFYRTLRFLTTLCDWFIIAAYYIYSLRPNIMSMDGDGTCEAYRDINGPESAVL